jgi:hypothetical protein
MQRFSDCEISAVVELCGAHPDVVGSRDCGCREEFGLVASGDPASTRPRAFAEVADIGRLGFVTRFAGRNREDDGTVGRLDLDERTGCGPFDLAFQIVDVVPEVDERLDRAVRALQVVIDLSKLGVAEVGIGGDPGDAEGQEANGDSGRDETGA